MRFTLEETDLIQLIGQALGYNLQPEDVTVNADPFEVRIRNVDLHALAEARPKATKEKSISPDDIPDEDETNQEEEEAAVSILTMGEILSQNTELKNKPQRGPSPKRPLGPLETEEPPPYTEAEWNVYK